MAFNVMSTLVDWQRDDLFHLSFDTMAQYVSQALSRHFVVRHDYGAYEYTTVRLSLAERTVSRERSGYLHPAYASSFDDIATPRELPACGAWILERGIAGSNLRDAMGCYPLFCCRDWTRLPEDVAALAGQLVSFTLVTDPFGEFGVADLQRVFDVVRPFKHHYIRDLANDSGIPAPRRHKRNTAAAQRAVALVRVDEPMELADEWVALYGQLVERHDLTGLHAFSRRCLERQLAVPGVRMFSASAEDASSGYTSGTFQGDVAYGHLGATSRLGYDLMASYALYAFAIEQLRPEVRWLALGSAPAIQMTTRLTA